MLKYLSERKGAIYFGLAVMAATLIPYLIGYSVQGDAWRFSGFLIGVEDGNSYIAKMFSGASGSWLFRSPYSIEEQNGVVAYLPYLMLGKLTSSPAQHEQLVALYQAFRLIAGLMAVLASFDFISLFILEKKSRLWALYLTILGGGAGWVLAVIQGKNFFGSIPLDFISPESFGFLGLLGFPHLAASRALLLWGMVRYLGDRDGFTAGLLWLIMGLMQPLSLLVAWAVIGTHSIAMWWLIRSQPDITSQSLGWGKKDNPGVALRAILVSSPLFIYTGYMFLTDPYLQSWTQQNVLPSPGWIHYLIAYGLVLPFSLVGIFKLWQQDHRRGLLLAVWIGIFPVLVSAPLSTQRRLAEGIWVIMITGMVGYFSETNSYKVLYRIISILVLPTSILLLSGSAIRAANPSRPVFIPAQEVSAYHELRDRASTNAKVLSTYQTGNNLPAWAPVRMVIGHGPESVNLERWQDLADQALGNDGDNHACRDMLLKYEIDFLFWGPDEISRWSMDPNQQECLERVYSEGNYKIFQVER